jgi:small-conductance mechanosensitive channel
MNFLTKFGWIQCVVVTLVLAFVTVALVPQTALAQSNETKNAAAKPGEIESLLKTIENEAEREKLVGQLRLLLETQKAAEPPKPIGGMGSRLVAAAAAQAKEFADQLTTAADSLRNLPAFYDSFVRQARDPDVRGGWVRLVIKLLTVIVVGYVAHILARGLLARPRRAIEGRETDSIWLRIPFLLVRTGLDFVPIIALFGVALAVLPLTEPSPQTRDVITRLLNAYLIVGVTVVIARMLLVPKVSGLRVLPLRDGNANYLFIWARRFVHVGVYGLFLADAALIVGASPSGFRAFAGFIGLVVLTMGVMFVLQNRQGFASFLRGDVQAEGVFGLRHLRNRFADIWHALAIIYLVAIYGIWVLRIEGGFEFMLRASLLTVLFLSIAHGVSLGLRRLVVRGFSLRDELKQKYPSLEQRANRYLPVLQTVLRWGIYLIAALAILGVWGVDITGWLEGPTGQRFVSGAVSIVIVLLAALVLWEGVSAAIERYLTRAGGESVDRARRARAQTLLPLLRTTLMIVIVVMVALVILSELGINIGPLLAGAGVVGLAIGFGSQKLVQDVITGAFILFEDSMAVGDVVRIAGATGTVEALSIRSIRMRDASGNVHTVPFSSVAEVTNLTKEYSYYLFEIGIAYRESVDNVMAVLRDLGTEYEADPVFGPLIMAPLDIQGVDSLGDSAVVIRARYKTHPVQQWRVGREFNRRIKNRFDELGIEIPFPHTTIYFGEDKNGDAPPLRHTVATEKRPQSQPPSAPEKNVTAQPLHSTTPSDSGQADE